MRKSLLAFGTILATAAPVAGAVSCTLIKDDHISSYVTFKQLDTIESIINDFQAQKGANIGITPWLSSFWKERANKLLGALNYKSNNNGIIASNGFSKNDIKALSRLLESQTWLEYGSYDINSVGGKAPTDAEKLEGDIRIFNKENNPKWFSTPSEADALTKWLSSFNINNGRFFKDGEKIQAFVNGKLREFNAWNTEDERTFFNKENVFEKGSVQDPNNPNKIIRPKDVEEEVMNEIHAPATERDALRKFVASQVHKLSPTATDKYNFVQQRDGEEINFYIAYNVNANSDAGSYNPEDVTIGNNLSYNTLSKVIQDWFKSFGISVKVIRVPLDGKGDFSQSDNVIATGPNAGKPFTMQTLAEIANSDEKALVYMPVDSWLSSGGNPKGSLLLQKRSMKTVGDDAFFENVNGEDPIYVNEPKLVEQVGEIYSSFPGLVSGNDYSLIHFFDLVTTGTSLWSKETKAAYDAARDEASAIRTQLYDKKNELAAKGMSEAEIVKDPAVADIQTKLDAKNKEIDSTNWYWSDDPKFLENWTKTSQAISANTFFNRWVKGEDNTFRDKSVGYRTRAKNLPVLNQTTKGIDYKVNDFYTSYKTQFIFSPDITLKDETQRLFSEAIDKNAPKASNNYSWTVNARSALPLPITVGYSNDEDGALRSNILEWIQEHFIM